MENIITKSCNQFGTIRQINEVPALWCGSDVAKALGYARPHDAISAHCRCTVKRRIPHPQSKNRTIEMSFIPEADVYRLICHSKLPKAQEFEKWVFEDVVPEAVRGCNSPTPAMPYEYLNKTYGGQFVMTTNDLSQFLNVTQANVSETVRKKLKLGTEYYFLEKTQLAWFKAQNPNVNRIAKHLIIVTKKGFDKLCEIYGVEIEKPECLTIKPKSDNDTDMLKRICKDNNLAIVPLDDEIRDMMKDMFKDTKDVEYLWEINDKKYILYDENAIGIRKQYLIAVGIAQFMNIGGTPTITPEKIFASVFTALSLFNQYKEK